MRDTHGCRLNSTSWPEDRTELNRPISSHPLIQLGSLDTFWFPSLQKALAKEYATDCWATWSFKRGAPDTGAPIHNAYALHYLLQLYKMFPWLQWGNRTYYGLCCAFDAWLSAQLSKKTDALCYLSGCGLWSARRHRKLTAKPVVVDSGSTHTDWQHRVVLEEFRKNGNQRPLFPECYRERIRTEFKEADWIQIPSRFVAQTYLENGIPERKLLLAAYGADLRCFTPRARPDPERGFRIICPSGVNLRKGARILVEAWKKLGWKDAKLHWVGSPGEETAHLFNPMPHGIVWHPHMDHIHLAALYRDCDVLVLPSFEEGFARVLIEGAASGLALVATPNSGVEEFFTDGNPEGWLIPPGDSDALCEALIEAKQNSVKTFEKGVAAAARARSGFSWADYGARVRKNFHKVLGR